MNSIYRRMVVRFFAQLAFAFILLLLSLLAMLFILGFFLNKAELRHNLAMADRGFIANQLTRTDEALIVGAELEELIVQQQGWLLIYDRKGDLRASFHVPEDVTPNFTDLLQPSDAEYAYSSWTVDEAGDDPLIVMYGQRKAANRLLADLLPTIDWAKHTWAISEDASQYLQDRGGSAWLLSDSGEPLTVCNAQPKHWSPAELLALAHSQEQEWAIYKHPASANVLLVMLPYETADTSSPAFMQQLSNPLLIWLMVILLLFLLGSLWYASRFGTPLLAFMRWIGNLGNRIYASPTDKHGQSLLYHKNGKLKGKYTFYREIIQTLEQVTRTLEQDEKERLKMKKTREEWIGGLSHDLKTPLSSIMGYVKMLQSDQHHWSAEEKQAFLHTIDEKSTYMFELMEDLALTFRIKNDSLPLVKVRTNINETIRRTLIQRLNMPDTKVMYYDFNAAQEDLFVPVDPKWWQRILDNLLMNAVQYNPSGTTISLGTDTLAGHLAVITIADDGSGMDAHTVNQLFQRYYRGTSTKESSSGTGLGMAITKQLIKLHGGSIQVTSRPGEGTRFRILLPL